MAYRKAGYSKKFFEGHREAITLHKAAKEAFEQLGLKKLPRVKELNAEYAQLLEQKRAAYPAYRKARTEMQEYLVAQKVAAVLLEKEKEQAAMEERARKNSAPISTDDLGGAVQGVWGATPTSRETDIWRQRRMSVSLLAK